MATRQLQVVLQHLRKLAGAPAHGEVTDGQLLERFIGQRDDAAFVRDEMSLKVESFAARCLQLAKPARTPQPVSRPCAGLPGMHQTARPARRRLPSSRMGESPDMDELSDALK